MKLPGYHESFDHLHVNTLPSHAYFIPCSSREQALADDRADSDRFLLLSGGWSFRYYESPLDIPEDVLTSPLSETVIPVPSVWQCQGYDHHQYTNTRYPIPFDPPYVPFENPCGLYSRCFSWQTGSDEKAVLCFEGVDSCFYLWINGTFVGYSQVSHSTSEFDVTAFLRPGANRVDVLVLKWSDGTYFEDQDKLRTSGIFRDVYLLRRSAEHLQDYFVHTSLRENYTAADIRVDLVRAGSASVHYSLLSPDGAELCSGEAADQISISLTRPELWNSESPALYTLLLHCGEEWIAEKIGLREIRIIDGIVCLNGQPVKFRGVNRHDSDPFVGPAVGMKEMLRDLQVMRLHNVNAIRTSHYPNAPEFVRLCDRYGFYLIDEADIETHGVGGAAHNNDYLADNPAYAHIYLDRVQRCVQRDKNRPSVLIWSMGNESGAGCCFVEAQAWTKAFDPSRLVHYERSWERDLDGQLNTDLFSRMYPSLEEMEQYFRDNRNPKPYILCEYCHAMGNGPGDLEDYFRFFHAHPRHCGGFVWEWCDHAVYMGRTADGKQKYFYGGDFGEYPHDGNFCMDGLVYPDRTPHQGLLEFRNVYRPARLVNSDPAAGRFTFWNTLDFTPLRQAVSIRYTVRQQGQDLFSGEVPADQLNIPPHGRGEVTLSWPQPLSGDCAVHFFEYAPADTPLIPAGTLLGEDEAGLQHFAAPALPEESGSIEVHETDRQLILSGPCFRYAYSKTRACFDEMTFHGRSLLDQPMSWNIWRAPTDNDRRVRESWVGNNFDRAYSRAHSTSFSLENGVCTLHSDFVVCMVVSAPAVTGTVTWTVHPNGEIRVSVEARRDPNAPALPRFGLRLFLPRALSDVEYFGYGPFESYADKHRASFRHLWHADLADLHEDYLKPQENGSHYGCEYLALHDVLGGLRVRGENFSFNASPYTQEELTQKPHSFELSPCGSAVLCLDAFQTGIGSNSCGPALLPEYTSPEEIRMDLTLSPFSL